MRTLKGRFEGLYPAESRERIGRLLELINSFFSTFPDGNGRVVRKVTHLQLMKLWLASGGVFPWAGP